MNHLETDIVFLLRVPLDDALAEAAVVAHVVALARVELFAEEAELELPPAHVGLLAVVQDRVQSVQVLILSQAGSLVVHNEEVGALPVVVRVL